MSCSRFVRSSSLTNDEAGPDICRRAASFSMTPRLNHAVSATAASIAATSSLSVRLRSVMSEFVARIGRLACRDGWRRRTPPPMTLDPPCRSKPMLIAVTISPNSGAG